MFSTSLRRIMIFPQTISCASPANLVFQTGMCNKLECRDRRNQLQPITRDYHFISCRCSVLGQPDKGVSRLRGERQARASVSHPTRHCASFSYLMILMMIRSRWMTVGYDVYPFSVALVAASESSRALERARHASGAACLLFLVIATL